MATGDASNQDSLVDETKDASPPLFPTLSIDAKEIEMENQATTQIEEAGDVATAIEDTDEHGTADTTGQKDKDVNPNCLLEDVGIAVPAEDSQCLICYDTLFSKDEWTQTCCKCRASVEMIADMETGEELEEVKAYGSTGQPTRALIDGVFYYSQDIADELREEADDVLLLLSKLAEQERVARMSNRRESYITDFSEENAKLQYRLSILEQIEAEWAVMRTAQLDRDHAAAAAANADLAAPAANQDSAEDGPAVPQEEEAAPEAATPPTASDAETQGAVAASLDSVAVATAVSAVSLEDTDGVPIEMDVATALPLQQQENSEVEERTVQPTAADAAGTDITEEEFSCSNFEHMNNAVDLTHIR